MREEEEENEGRKRRKVEEDGGPRDLLLALEANTRWTKGKLTHIDRHTDTRIHT